MEGQQGQWGRSEVGRRLKSIITQGCNARGRNLDFLPCVMESLECFKQGNDMIQVAFHDDPFGCCVEDGCERLKEKLESRETAMAQEG